VHSILDALPPQRVTHAGEPGIYREWRLYDSWSRLEEETKRGRGEEKMTTPASVCSVVYIAVNPFVQLIKKLKYIGQHVGSIMPDIQMIPIEWWRW